MAVDAVPADHPQAVDARSDTPAAPGDAADPRCPSGAARWWCPTYGCVDLMTDVFECGACGVSCAGEVTATCAAGHCVR